VTSAFDKSLSFIRKTMNLFNNIALLIFLHDLLGLTFDPKRPT
jgi:hypothetical protein